MKSIEQNARVTFTSKPLRQPATIGGRLRALREQQGCSLAEMSARTKISTQYLEAIEDNVIQRLPPEVFRQHYLRRYTEALGLRWGDLVRQYPEEVHRYVQQSFPSHAPSPFGRHNVERAHTHERRALLIPQYLKVGGIAIVVLCVVLYLLWGLIKFVSPPELLVTEPSEDAIVHNRLVTIRGVTAPGALIAINDQVVNVSAEGVFAAEIPLLEGLNVLRISAKTAHSSERVMIRNILYTPSP